MIQRLLIPILILIIGLSYGEALGPSQVSRGPDGNLTIAPPEQAHQATVSLGAVTLLTGEAAEVELSVHHIPASGIAAFDIEINFDPRVIKVNEVLPGDAPWEGNLASISNERGLVRIVNARGVEASGSFVLARLKIEAVGTVDRSIDLALSSSFFRGADLEKTPVSPVDGLVSVVAPPADYDPTGLPWLRVEGNRIVDSVGRPVVLRGVNIENREWIWAHNQDIGFEIQAIPKATSDPPDGWGANVVLLAIASGPVNRNDGVYLGFLDELIALAKANGAYTLLAYRYPEPNDEQPPAPDQAAEDAMAALAARYADEPAVLYDLKVEPYDVSWSELKPRFTSMIDAIRANNPRALITVPGTQWSRYVHWVLDDPLPRDNLVHKVHFYDSFTTADMEFRLREVAQVHPLILGEFGAGSRMEVEDVAQLLDLAESLGISWIGWLFHEKGCPCMLSDAANFATTPYGAEVKKRLQAAAVNGSREGSLPLPVLVPRPVPTITPRPAAPSPPTQPTTSMEVYVSPVLDSLAPGQTLQPSISGSTELRAACGSCGFWWRCWPASSCWRPVIHAGYGAGRTRVEPGLYPIQSLRP